MAPLAAGLRRARAGSRARRGGLTRGRGPLVRPLGPAAAVTAAVPAPVADPRPRLPRSPSVSCSVGRGPRGSLRRAGAGPPGRHLDLRHRARTRLPVHRDELREAAPAVLRTGSCCPSARSRSSTTRARRSRAPIRYRSEVTLVLEERVSTARPRAGVACRRARAAAAERPPPALPRLHGAAPSCCSSWWAAMTDRRALSRLALAVAPARRSFLAVAPLLVGTIRSGPRRASRAAAVRRSSSRTATSRSGGARRPSRATRRAR